MQYEYIRFYRKSVSRYGRETEIGEIRIYTDRQTTDVATQICFLVMYILNNAHVTELFCPILYEFEVSRTKRV
jgi:hypothetical protein